MKKFRQARCPYCGKKVSLLSSWAIKTQGEYKCPKCDGISNIELDSAIQIFAILAVIVSGLIYIINMLAVKNISLFSILIISLPYLIFYLQSIFLVRLRKPVIRKKPPVGQKAPVRAQRADNGIREHSNMKHTLIMENFSGYSK